MRKIENLVPFRPGHDPRRGHGLPGRSGRKPLSYREALIGLESAALRAVEEALSSRRPHVRLRAAQDVLDRLHGRARQPIETVDEAREREVLASLPDEHLQIFLAVLDKFAGRSKPGR